MTIYALPDAEKMIRRSRLFRSAPARLAGVQATNLAEAVQSLPKRTVLFGCSDYWARAVAALPPTVLVDYPASIAPLAALDLLVDKARLRETLERIGIPHPRTRDLSSRTDLEAVPDSVLATAFLKPAHSQQFFARFGVKAFKFSDKADAINRLSIALDAGLPLMLQEYIPGPPTNHYFIDGFVDRDGVMRATFVRRRLRMNPPDFGNSTLMVSIPVEEAASAVSSLTLLLRHISYRGIFSAEFKRDERDGVFNLIEVNARPWWYVEFAARCGVNVCELAMKDALGERVDTVATYKTGRRCVFPYYDFEAVQSEYRAGRVSVTQWARSWLGAYQPVFRWSDPLPAAAQTVSLLRQRLRAFKA